MKILIVEPYYTGSHALWAEEYARYSRHNVRIFSMNGKYWKWRMHGGAVTMAQRFLASDFRPHLLLATSMLDLTTFLALIRKIDWEMKTAYYLHENQMTYPWSPKDRDVVNKRDMHYGFINYVSALAADAVFFNSAYHQQSFFDELPRFLKSFPDQNLLSSIQGLSEKSQVLSLGMDLNKFNEYKPAGENKYRARKPLILWNHRWEYDKNPEAFFNALFQLSDKGLDFEVAVLGECFAQEPGIFLKAAEKLSDKIVQFGFVEQFSEYASFLWKADIMPVTSNQDFFGGSVVQGLYCNCCPLLPKRLAYPEHVPYDRHQSFFYDDFDNLVEKLEALILNIEKTGEVNIQPFVTQYDWQNMAPIYDAQFEDLII